MPIELTTDQKRIRLQEYFKTNLRGLCFHGLGMKKWDNNLHGWVQNALESPGKEKLFLLPRGHLKTSIITVGWSIQQVLRDPNKRILINNAVWDNARSILSQISGYLTDRSALPDVFGPFKNSRVRWTRDEIEVAQKTKGTTKEATFETAGVESAKTGNHYDIIINDDIVVRENVTTGDQIEKVKNFHRDCYALLDPGGMMVNVGTRWAMGDLYGSIINGNMRSLNGHHFRNEEEKIEWRKHLQFA